MIAILRCIYQLSLYILIGYSLTKAPYIGAFFMVQLPLINKYKYCFNVWYWIDVGLCTLIHFTRERTISDWTGEHAKTKKRYKYQALVIDFIFYYIEGKREHCARMYRAYLIRQGPKANLLKLVQA